MFSRSKLSDANIGIIAIPVHFAKNSNKPSGKVCDVYVPWLRPKYINSIRLPFRLIRQFINEDTISYTEVFTPIPKDIHQVLNSLYSPRALAQGEYKYFSTK